MIVKSNSPASVYHLFDQNQSTNEKVIGFFVKHANCKKQRKINVFTLKTMRIFRLFSPKFRNDSSFDNNADCKQHRSYPSLPLDQIRRVFVFVELFIKPKVHRPHCVASRKMGSIHLPHSVASRV